MSRYIEEEAIIKAIDESGRRYGITTANQCNFKEIVRKTPTADVAPKSEVERLQNILNSYALQCGTVRDQQAVIDQAKSEVAREIFEEIEKCHLHITNEFDAIRYAELKKKCTEGKV